MEEVLNLCPLQIKTGADQKTERLILLKYDKKIYLITNTDLM